MGTIYYKNINDVTYGVYETESVYARQIRQPTKYRVEVQNMTHGMPFLVHMGKTKTKAWSKDTSFGLE